MIGYAFLAAWVFLLVALFIFGLAGFVENRKGQR